MGKKQSFQLFVAFIGEQLESLEHHEYDLKEKESFEKIMRAQVLDLKEAGVKPGDGKESIISFLSKERKHTFTDLNDEWFYRYAAKIKTAAVSTSLVPRWPWEHALFDGGKIEGCRETVRIPRELLSKMSNAREVGLGLIQGQACFADMKRILNNSFAMLANLDPTIKLDFLFMETVPEALTKKVKDSCIIALPTELQPKSFQSSLEQLEAIRRATSTSLVGMNLMGEVSGVARFVKRIMNKDAPNNDEVMKLSDFYRVCLKRMVNFFSVDVDRPAS
jgi:hypothetical protein